MTNADAKILLDACAEELILWADAVEGEAPEEPANLLPRNLLEVATAVIGDGTQSTDPQIRDAFVKLLRAVAYNSQD